MDNSVLKIILREYEIKRNKAIQDAENRKKQLLEVNPNLSKLENELAKISIQTSKAILSTESDEQKKLLSELKKKSTTLIKEKNKFIKELVNDSSYLKPHFDCKHCKDTGYVEKDGITTMCTCLKQAIFNTFYNKSNIGNLEKENFSKFNYNIYSNEKNKKLYKSELSPRENIANIREKAENFISTFNNPDEKNLIFIGNAGLGKTFMTNCIANELLKQGKTVLYQTAPIMFEEIINAKFGKENSKINLMNNILTVDLLIIDDLGSENTNDLYLTELFTIVNTRLLNQNNKITKTIISSNLTPEELQNTYTMRTFSRLVGSYKFIRFFGEDLRFKKK